ncbi:MAG: hypothetical protein U9N77_06035 [Thermodesulfobacteriota bacterium]|nr:hypothetical protein [Thermodesulfobacteriota bacterium]
MIRFTQYGDFNDPFELNPNIDKLAEKEEIRKLLPLGDSSKCINKKPYPIHLFEFPTQAINCVILGSRSSDLIQNQVKSLLKNDEFSHIKLLNAHLDSSSYGPWSSFRPSVGLAEHSIS